MATERLGRFLAGVTGLVFLAACAGAPPADNPAPRIVDRLVVVADVHPRIEWEIAADSDYHVGGGGGAVGACVSNPVAVILCLPVMAVTGIALGVTAAIAGAGDADTSKVRGLDLSGVASRFDLQARVEQSVAASGWQLQPAIGAGTSGGMKLQVGIERIKALSSPPFHRVWVHEMDVSWQLVDPGASVPLAGGGFRYEKVLSFAMRYDATSGRWIGHDDGRTDWAKACEELAAHIARELGPPAAAARQ